MLCKCSSMTHSWQSLPGQAVAWCISDKEDVTVIELFLRSVHNRAPNASVRTIMTDDGKFNRVHIHVHTIYFL